MRKVKYALPIWHYLGAVGCLIVLTLLAPFTWRSVVASRPSTSNGQAGRAVAIAPTTPVFIQSVSVSSPPVEALSASEPEASQLIAVFPAPSVVTHLPWADPSLAAIANVAPIELPEFAAPRHQAVAVPPVADRVQFPVRTPERTTEPSLLTSTIAAPAKRLIPVSSGSDSPVLPQRAEVIPKTPHGWPNAVSLIEQFRPLQRFDETQSWAAHAITTLEDVHRQKSLSSNDLLPLLDEMSIVAQQGSVLAENASSQEMRTGILRAAYATVRRELLWRQVHQIAADDVPKNASRSSQETKDRLDAVRIKLGNAAAWRKYLRLDEIQEFCEEADADVRAALARDVLVRMNSPKLTSAQRDVFQQPVMLDLERELRRWVVEPIAYLQLLDDIELYEQTRSAEAAHRIAASYQVIRWSERENIAKLAEILDVHYRNANLRVAVRDDLLNRLLPQQDDFEEEVDENIVGAQVFGNAQGTAHMRTVLIPDQRSWRFGLEVEGEIESQTAATRGPATFYNNGYSRYQARKLFQIDQRGMQVSDSEAVATMHSELTGFRTLFDSLPILGWVARGIVRQQHDDHTEMARWVSETRLETKMRERLDREVQLQLEETQVIVEKKITAPLERLELDPDVIEMRTTEDRLIARYRLAGKNHLGAFTPRPQAPSDSMLTVQVHETMLNNTLEKLRLDGRRTKLRQLYRDLADAFDRSDLEVPDDIPENITVQFADVNPVRVHCDNGKLTLFLKIAELKNRRNSWHHFEVRAEHLPDSTRLHANLVRDGVIQLIGKRLSFGDQIALRAIFSRALSKKQPFNIINSKLAEHPAIADLNVNQFVIADGWIGVSLGPNRVAAGTVPAETGTTVVR